MGDVIAPWIIGQCDVTCRTCCNTSDNVCLDLQNCHYSIYNQPIINLFTISYPKEGQVHYELRTDLTFLWIKVSTVIQTLSAANIKGKMSNNWVKRLPTIYRYYVLMAFVEIILVLHLFFSRFSSITLQGPSWS
jgi:hypothetical protein